MTLPLSAYDFEHWRALASLAEQANAVRSRDGWAGACASDGARHAGALRPRGSAAIKTARKHRARARRVTAR